MFLSAIVPIYIGSVVLMFIGLLFFFGKDEMDLKGWEVLIIAIIWPIILAIIICMILWGFFSNYVRR